MVFIQTFHWDYVINLPHKQLVKIKRSIKFFKSFFCKTKVNPMKSRLVYMYLLTWQTKFRNHIWLVFNNKSLSFIFGHTHVTDKSFWIQIHLESIHFTHWINLRKQNQSIYTINLFYKACLDWVRHPIFIMR